MEYQGQMGPLGGFGIAESQLDRIGYDPLKAKGVGKEPKGGRGGSSGFSMRSRRPMSDEQRVRAYGYEGNLSQMQNHLPPSLRGINSAPNAGVMLGAAAANVKSGQYENMQQAMDAQNAFNKKYPGYGIAQNIALTKASHAMVNNNNQAALKTFADNQKVFAAQGGSAGFNSNAGQTGSWTPGGSYTAPLAAVVNTGGGSGYEHEAFGGGASASSGWSPSHYGGF